jgi:microsomal dipeptidase-like Zn-dependent dipeptidase
MRNGRWTKDTDYGEGSASLPGFPPQPEWFRDNRDFSNIADGLADIGMSQSEIDGVLGANWLKFFADNFTARAAREPDADHDLGKQSAMA